MSSKLLNYPAATSNPHLASSATSSGAATGTGASSAGSGSVAAGLNLENLQLDDILCTVCQSVLVEPVFLPCQHRFCRNCLSGTIEKNNLNCPCCRKRFGTWYRNASRVNKLVHEQLWSAIQRQFREYLEEDGAPGGGGSGRCNGDGGGTGTGNGIVGSCFVPPTESVIHLSEPGEIRKEYENELQRYRKELIEEKKKELAASEKYIINLYKQEGIIDLVDSSDHLSISSSTSTPEPPDQPPQHAQDVASSKATKTGQDVHEVVVDDDEEAGPSGSFPIRNGTTAGKGTTSNNQSEKASTAATANQAAADRPGTSKSGSIISISSTSTASGASSSCISSASSRYSLSKSQDKTGPKGTGATTLSKPIGGVVKKIFTMAEVNKSELCIKPTKIHRRTSSQAGVADDDDDVDDGDSLRSELNHFKPILATTPKSCFSPKAIVRVPSVRPEAGTLPTSSSKTGATPVGSTALSSPTKSPFKPIDPSTPRRSAFSVVNVHLFTPPTTTIGPVAGTSKKPSEAAAASKTGGSSPKKRSGGKKGSNSSSKKKSSPSKATPAASRRKRKLKFSPTASASKVAKAKPTQEEKVVEPAVQVPRVTRRSINKEANRLKELIVSDQQRREAMIEQERRDFEFAQKLQKKFNRTRGAAGVTMAPEVIAKELLKQAIPPRRHSISYSLRQRISVMEFPAVAPPTPAVVPEPQPSTSASVPEVASRKRKTMAAPPPPPPVPQPPANNKNRKKPTKAAPAATAKKPIKAEPEPEAEPPAKVLRRSTRNRI